MSLKAWVPAAAAAALVLAAGRPAAHAAPPPQTESYKILTYNVGALPETELSDNTFGLWGLERAPLIAAHVLAGGYDIVIFNEATTDEMKDSLVAALQGEFPHYVREMYGNSVHRQDSGLMLFSRFAPAPISRLVNIHPAFGWVDCALAPPNEDYSSVSASASFQTAELDPLTRDFSQCSAAFHDYTDLEGDDSWAEKGVGWVRVLNPRTNTPINVFFSHMQASYDTCHEACQQMRVLNIQEAVAFIDLFAPQMGGAGAGERVHMAGDLNVVGDQMDAPWDEYAQQMVLGGFVDTGLRDPWRTDGTKLPDDSLNPADPFSDLGFTWDPILNPHAASAGNAFLARDRLDYILDRQSAYNKDCFQHMTIERHFDAFGQLGENAPHNGGDLSDHFPLAAVIGPDAPLCSPAKAKIDMLGDFATSIHRRGAYQWFRYDLAGTYTIDLDTPVDMEITAYAATDLSTPLEIWKGDSVIEAGTLPRDVFGVYLPDGQNDPTTVAPIGPFYLRVRAADPKWKGNYAIRVKKHDGSDWDVPIVLHAFITEPGVTMAAQTATSNAQIATYFTFRTKELWTGQKQQFGFFTTEQESSSTGNPVPLALSLHKLDHSQIQITPLKVDAKLTGQVLPAVAGEYFLRAKRKVPANGEEVSFDARWTTNLTTIDLRGLKCFEQEDSTGDDTIQMSIEIDGSLWYTLNWADFDTGQSKVDPLYSPIGALHSVNIASAIAVEIYEIDAGPDDGPDLLGYQVISSGQPNEENARLGVWHGFWNFDQDDAHYRLDYSKSW